MEDYIEQQKNMQNYGFSKNFIESDLGAQKVNSLTNSGVEEPKLTKINSNNYDDNVFGLYEKGQANTFFDSYINMGNQDPGIIFIYKD